MERKAPLKDLLHQYRDKVKKALALFLYSANKVAPFDLMALKTSEALEIHLIKPWVLP